MKSHRTSILGIAAILISAYCIHAKWNHNFHTFWQGLHFNLIYVVSPYLVGIMGGWIGIHAADHRDVKKHFHKHGLK